jgi:hypothetical protein
MARRSAREEKIKKRLENSLPWSLSRALTRLRKKLR